MRYVLTFGVLVGLTLPTMASGSGSAKVDLAWDLCHAVSDHDVVSCVDRVFRKMKTDKRDQEIHRQYMEMWNKRKFK